MKKEFTDTILAELNTLFIGKEIPVIKKQGTLRGEVGDLLPDLKTNYFDVDQQGDLAQKITGILENKGLEAYFFAVPAEKEIDRKTDKDKVLVLVRPDQKTGKHKISYFDLV